VITEASLLPVLEADRRSLKVEDTPLNHYEEPRKKDDTLGVVVTMLLVAVLFGLVVVVLLLAGSGPSQHMMGF
jgi:hypothetical protein